MRSAIVGVMPPEFSYPDPRYQLWSPLPGTARGDLPPVHRAALSLLLVAPLNPGNVPRLAEASLDARVLALTLAMSLATAIVFSLAPALQAAHADGGEALKSGGRTGAAGETRERLRSTLVVAEVALSVVLLV